MIQLLALLLTLPAIAGDKAGNGGNVVLCRDASGKVSGVKMLDHYEAETIWGFKLDLGDPSLDPVSKVKLALERARRFHPLTASQLEARADGFFADALLLSNVELTPVEDSGEYFLPTGCQLKQIAVQRVREFPQDKTFLVNKDVWDLLDNDGKAGLILHEIAYEKLLHTTPPSRPVPLQPESRMARYFNALVSSAGFDQLTLEQYLPQLNELWFLTDLALDGTVLSSVSSNARNGVTGTLPKGEPVAMDFNGERQALVPGSWVTWNGGKLVEASPVKSLSFTVQGDTFGTLAGKYVRLYATGVPAVFRLATDSTLTWHTLKLPLKGGSEVQFFANGNPFTISLAALFRWQPGSYFVFTGAKGSASFNEDGTVRSLSCIDRYTDFSFDDAQGRHFTCQAKDLKCYDGDGQPGDWIESITYNAAGKVESFRRVDPKNDYCSK